MHKRISIAARTLALIGGLLVVGSAVSAEAADVTPPEPVVTAPAAKADWRFQATIYGWLSGVSGDVGVRGIGPVGVDISPGQAISDLDGALMGSFGGFSDQFMFLTDFMLTKVSSDGQIRDGAFNYDYSQTQITVQGLVGYMLPLGMPQLQLAPTVGFRYQNLSADLGVSPAFGDRLHQTTAGHAVTDVLDALVAGVLEGGGLPRVVRIRHTADTSFLGLTAAHLAGSGYGIGIQAKGTAIIHQRDRLPHMNLELFSNAPLVSLAQYRAMGRNAGRMTWGETPEPIIVANDGLALGARFHPRVALLYAIETEMTEPGAEPEDMFFASPERNS